VVPGHLDDPSRPSGGNRYDRRVMDGMRELGWTVIEHHGWGGVRDDLPVVVDGLVALDEGHRHGAVVLLHMPFAEAHPELAPAERTMLQGAAAVVTTSSWTRAWVVDHHDLDPARVWVAEPGADSAALAPSSPEGRRLMCVGPVTRLKGHDVLVAALARVADLPWTCTCVGALDLEPELVARLRGTAIASRLTFTGPLPAPPYEEADLLVSASRHESYGMAATEALARGVPVLATDVGGHREAAGADQLLVPPDDPAALAATLRRWLSDPEVRERVRDAAARRRTELRPWTATARDLEAVLNQVAAPPV
jgi:glycosyltransferase involved in cell wall biosynthesis